MGFRSALQMGCEAFGLPLEADVLERCERYASLLEEWNAKMNLTAIEDAEAVAIKHFVDSAAVLAFHILSGDERMADVGTGAGFPGLVLKIFRPTLRLTLIDASGKRIRFLEAVITALGLENVHCLHVRAEDAGRRTHLREQFDLVVARAVAPWPVLSEFLLPLARIGGFVVGWKGPDGAAEVRRADAAIRLLGGETRECLHYELPNGYGSRTLIRIEKVKATPSAYPRRAGVPKRQPLT